MVTDATREDDSFAIRSQPQHSTRRAAAPQKAVNSQLFLSLGSTHRGGDAFPFRRQVGKIVGYSGEIAIDRGDMSAR